MNADAGRKIAENVWVINVARFATIFASVVLGPIIVVSLISLFSQLRSNEKMIDKHELRIERAESDLKGLRVVQEQQTQIINTALAQIQSRLATMDTNVAILTEQNKQDARRFEELLRFLEGRLGLKPPR